VKQVLAQIGSAKVFSKLDANSGFWQIEKNLNYLLHLLLPMVVFVSTAYPLASPPHLNTFSGE